MRSLIAPLFALALLTACGQKKPDFTTKVLIGATTIPAAGEAPIQDSVVVVSGAKIRSVGARKDVDVPQASDRTDLAGEWIVPPAGSRIENGGPANLIVLHHAPDGIAPAKQSDIGAQLVNGEWQAAAPAH
jgi:hypothetical protein